MNIIWSNPVNRAHPLNRGLLGWWLNTPNARGGLTWRDIAGGHHGTLTNMDPATDRVRGGRRNSWGALDFDGADDYVLVGNKASLRPTAAITYSIWIKRQGNGLGNNPHILRWVDDGNNVIGEPFIIQRGTDEFLWARIHVAVGGNVDVIDTIAIPLNVWTHYILTYDGANVRLFRNGGIVAGPTAVSSTLVYDNQDLVFGGSSLAEYFDGQLDDIRIYGRALNTSEVRQLYNLSRTGYGDLLNRRRMAFGVPAAPPSGRIMSSLVGGGGLAGFGGIAGRGGGLAG